MNTEVSETYDRIHKTTLPLWGLKYCFVDENKIPYRIDGTRARPNYVEDFVDLEDLPKSEFHKYSGIGISIQASKICAIDVDHCFSKPNRLDSADERAKDILNRFKYCGYCEFSFSGTGLRILFDYPIIDDYSDIYYIKNTKQNIEFYQPTNSFRYVTVTGRTIYDYDEVKNKEKTVEQFLKDYMLRPERPKREIKSNETRSFDDLMKIVKLQIFKNIEFQNLWFGKAPGSGKNESELDFHLLSCIYESITQDKVMVKRIFETSPYFASKDYKHKWKWENQDYRYFNYVYERIAR